MATDTQVLTIFLVEPNHLMYSMPVMVSEMSAFIMLNMASSENPFIVMETKVDHK